MTALEAVRPEADELRRRYGRDRRQLNEALLDLYKVRAVNPWAGWRLVAAAMVGTAYETIVVSGVLRPPSRQGLHDRLANVLVVADERGKV